MSTFEAICASPIHWVADRLAHIGASPVRRAVVLVPAERHAHAIRRLLCVERKRPDLLAGVLLVSPVEFARELLVRAEQVNLLGWQDVRRLRILQLFETALLDGTLRYFNAAQLREGQGYVDAFARTIEDLEAAGLDVALALRAAQRLARRDQLAADRLYDVAVTWEAADRTRGTRATAAQIFAAAARVAVTRPQLLTPFGPILAMLTRSPSTILLRFLGAFPDGCAVFQEARPQRAGTQRWRELIGLQPQEPSLAITGSTSPTESELCLVQRFLFEKPEILTARDRPRSQAADGTVDIEEHPSIEDEIEAAAVWITEQVSAGIPVEQIALIVPEVDAYAPLLMDRIARLACAADGGGIQAHVAGGLCLAMSPAGMRLQCLLNALIRGLEAEATIRLLPSLRRNNQGSEDGNERLSPSRAAEIVYRSGIIGGSPGDRNGECEWVTKLVQRRDAMRQLVEEAAPGDAASAVSNDEPEKRLKVRARHEAARWLRDVEPIMSAIVDLQQLAQDTTAGMPLEVLWNRLRVFCERWLRIPPDPPNLLGLLDESLQPILVDPVARAIGGPTAIRVFMEMLRRSRHATSRFGEPCVFIGSASHAAGLSFVAVRVLGLAEGALPHTPHDDPIVPDTLRKHIEAAARAEQPQPDVVLPRLADHVLDDIHDLFRVLSGTTGRLALSAPRQWVDRSEREVSGIMLETATALGRDGGTGDGDVPTAARLRTAYLAAGRDARARYAAAHPVTPRALLMQRTEPGAVPAGWTLGEALAIDQVWQRTRAMETDRLTAIDGLISEVWPSVQAPGVTAKRPISQSALTMLLTCPHRFLLERVLYLREPALRPSTDVIAPIDYGALFHAAAERFFREAGPALCRHEGSLDHWVVRAQEIAGEQFDLLRLRYPMRGEDGIERERTRLRRQIEQLVRYEWQLPPRQFLDSELSFGDPEPVRLALEDGELYVWGAIDRVDRMGPGALAVRDLKTGRVRDFNEDPINAGRDLQIGLYVLALESSGYAATPVRHAAYVHPSAAQEPDRAFAGENLEELRRHTHQWLSIAGQLLRTGAFPRTPNAHDCLYCPFVPACGENAQQVGAAKLRAIVPGHLLDAFAQFKLRGSDDEG